MKKLFWIAVGFVIALCVPQLRAQTAALQGFCSSGGAKVITQGMNSTTTVQASYPKCSVTVYLTGTTTKATIYSDNINTPLANPFTANTNASWLFYATSSTGYDIVMQGGTPIPFPTPFTLTDVMVGSGGGGGGDVLPAPQAFLYLQPNAGTNALAGPASKALNGVAPILQGSLNPDLYATGSGNNGILNAYASTNCASNCLVVVPASSTDTENSALPPSGSALSDPRFNSSLIWRHNPGISFSNPDAFSQNCNGLTVGNCNYFQIDINTGTHTAKQYAHIYNDLFEVPGAWNYGNAPQAVNPLWMFDGDTLENISFASRGITQDHGYLLHKYGTGDFAALYIQAAFCDGGQPDYSGEGCTGMTLDAGEEPAYFHGLVTAGATTGTQTLPVSFNASFTPTGINRQVTSDGSYVLDISRGTVSGTITGVTAAVSGVPYVYSIPVSNTLPLSTAYGNMSCDLPQPVPPSSPISTPVTCTITNIQGSTGTFTSGWAIISGDFPEGVIISAPIPASGGSQSVTFTYLHPHGATKTMLWQGGLAGDFIEYDENQAINNYREPTLHVFGAFDTSHLAVEAWRFGAQTPSPYTIPTEPQTIHNLSKSGTTVTATFSFGATAGTSLFNNQPSAVIAGCSDSSLNGTVTNVTQTIISPSVGGTLTWTQSGGGTSCASATISLPPAFFGYHLYPGAEQRQAAKVIPVSAGQTLTLEPNNVQWAAADLLEEPHHPFYSGDVMRLGHQVFNTLGQSQATKGIQQTFSGAGISNGYVPNIGVINNPCSIYIGCGGSLSPVVWFQEGGPNSGLAYLQEAPLGINAVIRVGCQDSAVGGCNNRQPILFVQFDNSLGLGQTLYYFPGDGVVGAMGGLGWDGKGNDVTGHQIMADSTGAFGAQATTTSTTADTFMSRLATNSWGFGSAIGQHDGTIDAAHGVFDTSLTVAGQNVCQANGTNCLPLPPIASPGTNGISQPDNSTIVITGGGTLSTAGFTGTCAPTTTATVVKGVITGCS